MKNQISPGRQVLLLIALIIGGLIILSAAFFLLFAMIFGDLDPNNLESLEEVDVKTGLLLHLSSQLGLFVLAFFVFLRVTGQKYKAVIHFSKWRIKTVMGVIGVFILAFLASALLAELNFKIVEQFPASGFIEMKLESEEQMMAWFSPENVSVYPFALLIVAALPAFVEELVFRGLLQRKLIEASNNNIHFGIIVSALIFAALHMQPWNLLPMIALGVLFGYVYHFTKDIRYTMLMHFLHNGVQITVMFYAPDLMV